MDLSHTTAQPKRTASLGAYQSNAHEISRSMLLWAWIQRLGLAFFIVLLCRLFVVDTLEVKGESMSPALHSGETMLLNKVAYRFGEPQRGDVVICRYPGLQDNFVKRIIALPGERVSVKNHTLYIDDQPVQENYILEQMANSMTEVIVPDGCYFVMGDNRNDSKDSRDNRVGALEKKALLAKVTAVSWPLPEWRTIPRQAPTQ